MTDYNYDGVRLLALAVIAEAANDYRTRTPCKRSSAQRDRKWKTADKFLRGETQGPGRMDCLEFCCQLANIHEPKDVTRAVIGGETLNDLSVRKGKDTPVHPKRRYRPI